MNKNKKNSAKLTTEERQELKDSDFGIPEIREFPMPDAVHVRAAEAYFRYARDDRKPELAHRILLKARKYGVQVQSTTICEWAKKWKNSKTD